MIGRQSFVCQLPIERELHFYFGRKLVEALDLTSSWIDVLTQNLGTLLCTDDLEYAFSMPSYLEINYFPPVTVDTSDSGSLLLREHVDPGLFSFFPFGGDHFFEWEDRDKVWHENPAA